MERSFNTTVRLSQSNIDYLDKKIEQGQWASNSHAFRWLINDFQRRHDKKIKGLAKISE